VSNNVVIVACVAALEGFGIVYPSPNPQSLKGGYAGYVIAVRRSYYYYEIKMILSYNVELKLIDQWRLGLVVVWGPIRHVDPQQGGNYGNRATPQHWYQPHCKPVEIILTYKYIRYKQMRGGRAGQL